MRKNEFIAQTLIQSVVVNFIHTFHIHLIDISHKVIGVAFIMFCC